MKEFKTFAEIYNIAAAIIEKNAGIISNLTSVERISYIRQITDKNILNDYVIIGNISDKFANSINAETTSVKISVDSLIKNLIEHSELKFEEYKNISKYLNNAEYVFKKNSKNLIYFKLKNKLFQFVVKRTQSGKELFVTTFHITNIKQLKKDILRYENLKKDSFDYEDSNYPSVT